MAQRVPVRISRPLPEGVVRGLIPITINGAAVPKDGYMVVEVNDHFLVAVAPESSGLPVTYYWDSRAEFPGLGTAPPDGQYTIRVKTYNSAFRFQRSNEINVYVRNIIKIPASQKVALRFAYPTDDVWNYTQKTTVTIAGQDSYSAVTPFSMTVVDAGDGVGSVNERVGKDATETSGGTISSSPRGGSGGKLSIGPNGLFTLSRRTKKSNYTPAFSPTVLPGKAIIVGEPWIAPLRVPGLFSTPPAIVQANHKLASLEYYLGHRAAKIVSQYEGAGTIAGQTPENVKITGTRVTFFDYERGRILRTEDTYTTTTPGSGQSSDQSGSTPETERKVTVVCSIR